jgi:hypothetical protein
LQLTYATSFPWIGSDDSKKKTTHVSKNPSRLLLIEAVVFGTNLLKPTSTNVERIEPLKLDAKARMAHFHNVSPPRIGSTNIYVQIRAMAINSLGPLCVAHPLGSLGRSMGSGFAGSIGETGQHIPAESNRCVEDEAAESQQGVCSVNHRPGAFV